MHESTALAHKIKGLKIVNERISDPKRGPEDFNIQAALIMSGIEVGIFSAFRLSIYSCTLLWYHPVIFRNGVDPHSP